MPSRALPDTFPDSIAYRILAMYGLYFFLLFTFIRNTVFEQIDDVWLDEMPNVDRIYNICMEVYLCREMRYFEMEENFYSMLIFIMRSREVAIKLQAAQGEGVGAVENGDRSEASPRSSFTTIFSQGTISLVHGTT
ncbi:hypothetical protein NQ318_008888 [Aromia moschata]|uniref:Piezo non-specific cation channel cap domain-containing protein n=1 Tax=Aromia moschata TaxID=1265417 RepID=A0AAV8ZDG0_9CUCU|nr:hypothetical protein NQ318_008888 [Aromia moschata]